VSLATSFVLVAIAGGFGAVARYWLSTWSGKLPWGILLANSIGSFIAGLAVAGSIETAWLVVGLAGGLSTFSTFAAQTHDLVAKKRLALASLNIVLNLLIPAVSFLTASILL
jgi:fluoride exporter